jgi:class 3 adenylate cyclase
MNIINKTYLQYANQLIKPKLFDSVCIIFIDIVNYCLIVQDNKDLVLVKNILDELFSTIDKYVIKYNLFNVETIGDAYLCISGLY